VCSMVPVPTEADEDARRCVRERQDLLGERVAIANGIASILATRSAPAATTRCDETGGSGWKMYGPRLETRCRRRRGPGPGACSTASSWC
jgi:transposase